ncbi:hypothetical protein Vadar_019127 [Vaccinium darrowii]|uniref:Uncharacterized protein n=1 Tax=Vaccinium darrowii TaxID=229202 RepID=A0ACB7YP02_9ERIC|nr:hypothetical protein Vadar_019127 [Vaccinium darrowii]
MGFQLVNWVFVDNVRDLLSSHELDKTSPLSAPNLRLLIYRLQIHSLHIKSKVHDYILSDHPINVEIPKAVANGVTYWCGCVDASRYPHDSIQPTASHFNSEAQNAPEMNPYTSLHHPNSPSSMVAETFCRCQWKTEKCKHHKNKRTRVREIGLKNRKKESILLLALTQQQRTTVGRDVASKDNENHEFMGKTIDNPVENSSYGTWDQDITSFQ